MEVGGATSKGGLHQAMGIKRRSCSVEVDVVARGQQYQLWDSHQFSKGNPWLGTYKKSCHSLSLSDVALRGMQPVSQGRQG